MSWRRRNNESIVVHRAPSPGGRLRRVGLGLALGALALSGTYATASATPLRHPERAPASGSGGNGFPVTLHTAAGTVTIAKRPTRVVSLSASATEDLFAIGAGPQVVAVDDDSDYPKDAPRTSLSGLTPNVEAIARYKPDLVVIAYDTGLVATLGKLGIPVVYQDAPATIAGAYADITQLGEATGDRSGAAHVVSGMRSKLAALVAKAPHLAHPLTYYVELSSTPFYSATSHTLMGDVFGLFHLRNIADAASGAAGGYPELSEEYVVKANPQLIFLTDTGTDGGQTAATVARRPGWKAIGAVAHHDVFALNADISSRWGPRLVDLAGAVEQALWSYERRA